MLIWRGPQLDQQLGAHGFVILDCGNQRMSHGSCNCGKTTKFN